MQLRAPWRGPTDLELEVVLRTKKAHPSRILTVKDKATGFPRAMPYGEVYQQKTPGTPIPGISSINANTFFVRSVETRFVGTKKLPKGIVIGGVEVWVRDIPAEFGGTEFSCVDFRRDICTEEIKELAAWANGVRWVDNAYIAEVDERRRARQEGQLETQENPVGVVAKVMAEAMKELQAHQQTGPTPEQLAKLGLVWDAEKQALVPVGATLAASSVPEGKKR